VRNRSGSAAAALDNDRKKPQRIKKIEGARANVEQKTVHEIRLMTCRTQMFCKACITKISGSDEKPVPCKSVAVCCPNIKRPRSKTVSEEFEPPEKKRLEIASQTQIKRQGTQNDRLIEVRLQKFVVLVHTSAVLKFAVGRVFGRGLLHRLETPFREMIVYVS